jgi:O-antigen/teichoic acid export membrane protein
MGGAESLLSLAAFGASLIALTVLVPILVRVLGAKEYGAWVLTGGLVNYIGLLDFGMSLTIARFVALEYKSNRRDAEEAIGVGLGVVAIIGLVAAAAILPFAQAWEHYLGVAGSAFALRAAVFALLLMLLSKVLQSALEGAGKVALSRLIQTAGTISFSAAAATVVFFTSERLEALSLILVANSAALVVTYALMLMREWGWKAPIALPGRSARRRVTAYALTMQSGSIVAFSVDPISRYLLAAAAGPAAVAPLDVALRAIGQWFGAAIAFTRPILPNLGHLANAEEASIRTHLLWQRFLGVAAASGGFLALVTYFVFPTLFGKVGHQAGALAAVGVLLWTPSVIAIVPYLYIVLYGRAREVFKIQAVTSGVGIAVTLTLVWSIGAWAPVIGMGLGALFGGLLTLEFARRLASGDRLFSLAGVSPLALAAPLLAGIVLILPLPLAVRLPLATVAWMLLCFKEFRALLRVL